MLELLTTQEMARADALTIRAGTPGPVLMERAGAAVANWVALHHPGGRPVLVVAGTGSNGGDGFVAARHLADRGYDVEVRLVGDREKIRGDALQAAGRWRGRVSTGGALPPAAAVIDALFGAGLDRPVAGNGLGAIEAMNAHGAPVYAVDLPSGINGTTGEAMGGAVRARSTVTFFRMKPGHLLLPGWTHCGSTHVFDIGIPALVLTDIAPQTSRNEPALWAAGFPMPMADGHKYTRGHAVVVSGGVETTGAARLAARGALRAGAGLVTIASPREALAVNATANLAIMVRAVDGAGELTALLDDRRRNVIVLGPGGGVGPQMLAQIEAVLRTDRALVLDADALTSLGAAPSLMAQLKARRAPTVLTPHEGEYARMFDAAGSKLARARHAAADAGAVVVLKGADTVVAAPDGRAAIATNAPPWLATAGSGDVLAGFVAGLLAQGMDSFDAACAAVWLHGESAAAAGPGLIADDLPQRLPGVYRSLLSGLAALIQRRKGSV